MGEAQEKRERRADAFARWGGLCLALAELVAIVVFWWDVAPSSWPLSFPETLERLAWRQGLAWTAVFLGIWGLWLVFSDEKTARPQDAEEAREAQSPSNVISLSRYRARRRGDLGGSPSGTRAPRKRPG